MSVALSGGARRLPTVFKFIITGAFLLAGAYLATNVLAGLSAQTEDGAPVAPEGYHTAEDRHTSYSQYNTHEATSAAYTEHIDTYFKLFTKEENGRLHISINVPRMHYPAGNDRGAWQYALHHESGPSLNEAIIYSTVADPADCDFSLFGDYYRVPEDLAAETSWPLQASDWQRYYCIKIRLKVQKSGFDYLASRVFLTDRRIEADGLNEYLNDFPGFSQTVNQDTDYDDTGWFPDISGGEPSEFRNGYQAHLNGHFHLFSRYEDSRFDLRLTLPGHFAIDGQRDVNDFSLQYVEYATVANRDDCDRDLFDNDDTETSRDDNPAKSMSLTPANGDYGKYYCVKVGIKGERTLSLDFNSYRVFFIPQITIDPDPDDVWTAL